MQLQVGYEVYQFHWLHEVQAGLSPFALQDAGSVRQWLQRFRYDSDALLNFRSLLMESDWGMRPIGLSDDEVLDQLAWRLQSGQLWTVARVEMYTSQNPEEPQEIKLEAAPPPQPQPKAASSAPAPEQEEPTFGPNADLAAIVAAKKVASALGVPFCEECAKLALQSAAKPAPPTPTPDAAAPAPRPVPKSLVEAGDSPFADNADLIRLAEVTKQAAKDGIPFCEECAKAAAAKAAQAAPIPEGAPLPPMPKSLVEEGESAFSPEADLKRLAETLTLAAKDGVSFCEECAKAAAAKASQAAPIHEGAAQPPVPKSLVEAGESAFSPEADLKALAANMTSAAKEGIGFCEECAKAAAENK